MCKNFDSNARTQQDVKGESIWAEPKVSLKNQNNVYIDGYDRIGDLCRKREQEYEVNVLMHHIKVGDEPDFISTVKRDVMSTTEFYS